MPQGTTWFGGFPDLSRNRWSEAANRRLCTVQGDGDDDAGGEGCVIPIQCDIDTSHRRLPEGRLLQPAGQQLSWRVYGNAEQGAQSGMHRLRKATDPLGDMGLHRHGQLAWCIESDPHEPFSKHPLGERHWTSRLRGNGPMINQ